MDKWRELHEKGVPTDTDGNYTCVSLDNAAAMVGLSRKTLDDYYSQIKRGLEIGFNFEANKEQKMGVLRKFVKLNWQ